MIKELEYSNRQILPRWVPFSQIYVLNPKINFMGENSNLEKENFKKLENTWNTTKTVPLAVEIITSSHILDIADTITYKEALDWLINNHCEEISNNTYLKNLLGNNEQNVRTPQKNIHSLRQMSFINPADDITWVDLAFFYAIQGQQNKAEKCIENCLSLRPNNIFSIKAILKYLLLSRDIDKALWLINSNDNIKSNPQIISTEIAICETYGIKSKLLRKGYSITKDLQLRKFFENELFATMATMEFNSGNMKKGQKLFSQSLLFPNENILAQTRYISTKFNKNIDSKIPNIPCTYERDSWISYNEGKFENVLKNTTDWFYFQPFSTTPILMNSYINSLIYNKEKEAIEMVRKALKIVPNNFSLLNNEVVSLFRLNETEKGNLKLSQLEKCKIESKNDATVLLATKGLADFRNGKIAEGTKKYRQAIEYFKINNNFEAYSRALYYFSYELKNIKDPVFLEYIAESKKMADQYSYKDIQVAIAKNFKEDI